MKLSGGSSKTSNPIMRAPPSRLHLKIITSQRPLLLMPSYQELGTQHLNLVCWLLDHVLLFATPWTVACQAPRPWNFPGKNTGVGSHSLLQWIYWPKDWTKFFCIAGKLQSEPPGTPLSLGVDTIQYRATTQMFLLKSRQTLI